MKERERDELGGYILKLKFQIYGNDAGGPVPRVDASLMRTLSSLPLVSRLWRFHCTCTYCIVDEDIDSASLEFDI